MKKSLFNTLGVVGIMAMVALNIYVVTSKETPAFLKWDAMSIIFANGSSGSGSGGETENGYRNVWKLVKEDVECPNDFNKKGDKLQCERELNPPSEASGCSTVGSIRHLGCD